MTSVVKITALLMTLPTFLSYIVLQFLMAWLYNKSDVNAEIPSAA